MFFRNGSVKILMVEKEANSLEDLANLLKGWDYCVKRIQWKNLSLEQIGLFAPVLMVVDGEKLAEIESERHIRTLKGDERVREIPLIFTSAVEDRELKTKAFQVGGADYLPQPFHPEEVRVRLENQRMLASVGKWESRGIEERDPIEASLRQSEEQVHPLAEHLDEVFWLCDAQHRREIYVSLTYEKIWGRSRASLYENLMSWTDSIHPDDRDRVLAEIPKQVRGEYDIEYRIIQPGGEIRWIRDRAFPICDATGRVRRIAGVARDLSDRVAAEEVLQQSETRYQAVVEAQTDLIARFKPDGTLTFVNAAYCSYFARSPEDLLGRSFLEFVPERDRQRLQAYLQHLSSLTVNCPANTHEHQVIKPDGTLGWQQWTNRAIFNPHGQIVEFQAVGRDIAQLKATEAQLKAARDLLARRVEQQQEQLRAIAENSPDPIARLDRQGRCVYLNQAAEQVLGLSATDAIGKTYPEIGLPPRWQLTLEEIIVAGERKFLSFERPTSGGLRYYQAHLAPEFNGEGKVEFILCLA
ncbi:MAG: PAS domain S-box protein, partial [Cyanobacteriota bacterium]|nr:PAS domain S-box protein [Cyanobacteriota bacterium]